MKVIEAFSALGKDVPATMKTNFPPLVGKEEEIDTLGKVAAQLTRARRNGYEVDGIPLDSPFPYVEDKNPNSSKNKVTFAVDPLKVARGYIEFLIANRDARTSYDMSVHW